MVFFCVGATHKFTILERERGSACVIWDSLELDGAMFSARWLATTLGDADDDDDADIKSSAGIQF